MNVGLMRYKDSGWSARPIYYIWSLITRYTVPESEIYPLIGTEDSLVRAAALKSPDGKWTILVTNFSDKQSEAEVELENVSSLDFRKHTVTEKSLPDDSSIVPYDAEFKYGDGISVSLPPKSFTVLTQIS